jgi:hypothetical protein
VEGRWEADHGYHPRRGGRYDANEDRSLSPPPLGPQDFTGHILHAPFPQWHVLKYSGESNLGLWLEDYRLACRAGSVDDDYFIIRNLPLFIANSARTWLDHLLPDSIRGWANLMEIFMENF